MSPRLLVVVAAALAALVVAAPARAAGPYQHLLAPPAACGAQTARSASVARQERAMRCMVNFARRAAGVSPRLASRDRLMRSAQRKAADILRCGDFSHTACGHAFTYHQQQVGYARGCYGAGENIAWGSRSLGTVRSIMAGWLNSDGHRANLLDGRFEAHGVGLVTGTMSGQPGAAVWVHQLGYRC